MKAYFQEHTEHFRSLISLALRTKQGEPATGVVNIHRQRPGLLYKRGLGGDLEPLANQFHALFVPFEGMLLQFIDLLNKNSKRVV